MVTWPVQLNYYDPQLIWNLSRQKHCKLDKVLAHQTGLFREYFWIHHLRRSGKTKFSHAISETNEVLLVTYISTTRSQNQRYCLQVLPNATRLWGIVWFQPLFKSSTSWRSFILNLWFNHRIKGSSCWRRSNMRTSWFHQPKCDTCHYPCYYTL